MKTVQGTIRISAPTGGTHDIYITIGDDLSGIEIITAKLNFKEFGEAVAGRRDMPCQLEVTEHPEIIGLKRERKIEQFFYRTSKFNISEKVDGPKILQQLSKLEHDGWKASLSHAFHVQRGHEKSPGGFNLQVEFIRFVK